jgi:hypothetical protein
MTLLEQIMQAKICWGFGKASLLNKALLAKQFWGIVPKPNCPMSRVLKQKYFKRTTPLV